MSVETKVKEIFESVTLSEEIDTSNPDFLLICERGIPGLGGFINRLFGRGLKVKPPRVTRPRVDYDVSPAFTAGKKPITSSSTRPSTGATVTRGSNQGAGLKDKVTTTLRNNKGKIIGGAATGGAVLGGAALLNNILPPEPGDGNAAPREQPKKDEQPAPPPATDPDADAAAKAKAEEEARRRAEEEAARKKAEAESPPKRSYGWWRLQNQQPELYKRSPGYQTSLKAYRNIRANPIPSIYKDHYEVIADYLIKEGHASDIEEANYVMQQLDEEFIQNIIDKK